MYIGNFESANQPTTAAATVCPSFAQILRRVPPKAGQSDSNAVMTNTDVILG